MGTTLDELETATVQQDIADALALIERANAKLRPTNSPVPRPAR